MRNPLPSARESDSTFPDRKCDDFDARSEGATNLMNIDQRDDARWSFGHVRAISRAHRAGCRVNVSFTFPFHRARISQNLPRARGTPLLWQWWAKYAEIIFFCQPLECWKWTQWTLQDPMQYYTHCNITWKWIVFGKRFWTIFQTFRNHLCVTSSHILFETNMSENFIK